MFQTAWKGVVRPVHIRTNPKPKLTNNTCDMRRERDRMPWTVMTFIAPASARAIAPPLDYSKFSTSPQKRNQTSRRMSTRVPHLRSLLLPIFLQMLHVCYMISK
eukprot:420875-Amphidinium_carterae.1